MSSREEREQERKRLFRRMEWVYVWVPPMLAVVIAGLGALLVAAVVPSDDIGFWGRWGIAMVVILILPTIVYIVRSLLDR